MPVFMFTLHAYRSWMPDHRRGFVIRSKGIQKRDPKPKDLEALVTPIQKPLVTMIPSK